MAKIEVNNVFKFKMGQKVSVKATKRDGEIKECRYSYKFGSFGMIEEITYLVNLGSYDSTYKEEQLQYPDELPFKAQLEVYEKMINITLGVDNKAVIYYNDLRNKLIEANKKK